MIYIAACSQRRPTAESFHTKMDAHIGQSHIVGVTSKKLLNDCNFALQLIQIIKECLKFFFVQNRNCPGDLTFFIPVVQAIKKNCDDVSHE